MQVTIVHIKKSLFKNKSNQNVKDKRLKSNVGWYLQNK